MKYDKFMIYVFILKIFIFSSNNISKNSCKTIAAVALSLCLQLQTHSVFIALQQHVLYVLAAATCV